MQKFSRVIDFLDDLNETIGWIMYRGPGHLSMIGYGPHDFYKLQEQYRRGEEARLIRYLKNQKIIEARKIGDRLEVRLTDKGFRTLLTEHVKRYRFEESDEVCLLIFDIPETQRARRQLLVELLHECGFKKLQKSVYQAPKNIAPILLEFVQYEKLTPWIHIIEGKILTQPHRKQTRAHTK